jgi:hypothetical protein
MTLFLTRVKLHEVLVLERDWLLPATMFSLALVSGCCGMLELCGLCVCNFGCNPLFFSLMNGKAPAFFFFKKKKLHDGKALLLVSLCSDPVKMTTANSCLQKLLRQFAVVGA